MLQPGQLNLCHVALFVGLVVRDHHHGLRRGCVEDQTLQRSPFLNANQVRVDRGMDLLDYSECTRSPVA